MRNLAKSLALALMVTGATLLQGCFWLLPVTQPSELHYATTPDNWKLALHRYKPEVVAVEKEPLILVHGYASNRYNFDIAKDRSLPLYLQEKGYDVWILELRGSGESSTAGIMGIGDREHNWNFDTHVEVDAPTAVEFVRYETRREQLSWIGHSMGGMVGYAYLGLRPGDRSIRSFVALSAPATFELKSQALSFLLQFKGLAELGARMRALRPVAQVSANSIGWLDNNFAEWKGFVAPQTAIESLLWNNETIDARTMSMFAYNAVSNTSPELIMQTLGWIESGNFRSADGLVDYYENIERIQTSTLVMTGKLDTLCPPVAARKVYEKLGTTDKGLRIIGKENGYTGDYGHVDLVVGSRSREDVFPIVFAWLESH